MDIKTYKIGNMDNNTYLLVSRGEALVIDPGGEPTEIIAEIKNGEAYLRYILLTHGHFDHVLGVETLKESFPEANVIIGEGDLPLVNNLSQQGQFFGETLPDFKVKDVLSVADGASLPFGDELIKVLATPGHTKGSVCYVIDGALFSGDTLFYRTYGRIDLPHSEPASMKESLEKIFDLSKDLVVYPGHGRPTKVGEEKNFYGQGS
jgi:hydroxyacylglutathione hydrolase